MMLLWRGFRRDDGACPDEEILRAELFDMEQIEELGCRLAKAMVEPPYLGPGAVLLNPLRSQALRLQRAHATIAASVGDGQVAKARSVFPARLHEELPTLVGDPLSCLPRVLGLAHAFVAHGDSCLDPDLVATFVRAHQQVQPRTSSEEWALQTQLRFRFVEMVRCVAQCMVRHGADRSTADDLVAAMLGGQCRGIARLELVCVALPSALQVHAPQGLAGEPVVAQETPSTTAVTHFDGRRAMSQPSVARFSRPQQAARSEVEATRREPSVGAEMMRWADDGGAPPTRSSTT